MTGINEVRKRLQQACIAGMDAEYVDDVSALLADHAQLQKHGEEYREKIRDMYREQYARGELIDRLEAENARLQADSERLDWMDSNHFTDYRQCDPIEGISGHCVVVPEAVTPRRGCVNYGIREAIDAAKAVQP